MHQNPTGDALRTGDRTMWPPPQFSEGTVSDAGNPPRMRLPGWILIGSTGRKSGKTEFACAIIRAFHRQRPIVAVKVTTITEGESTCPRGGEGCGACSTLEGDFHIGEERGEQPGKDTARMLESGAQRVFWLRCRRPRMRAALEALMSRLDRGVLVVAESNSLAQAIEPDLFLMVTGGCSASIKPSAAEVLSLAHRVVVSADNAFDPDPRHLAVVDGVWHFVDASAAILAGGKSSRMGQDKSLLALHGKPLIHHIHEQLAGQFDEILISTNEPEKYRILGTTIVPDRVPGMGPLMGIASAVEAARHARVFVTACDIPVVDLDTVIAMLVLAEDFDCVIPLSSFGREPLFAVYRKSALPAMREVLRAGERRISAIFPRVRTRFFALGHVPWYRNLNTREDVEAFLGAR